MRMNETVEFSEKLEEEVKMALNNPEWEMEYAAYYVKLRQERKAGEKEGLEQGLKQGLKQGLEKGDLLGRQKMLQKLLDQGKSIQEIAAFYNMEDNEISEILNWKPEEAVEELTFSEG